MTAALIRDAVSRSHQLAVVAEILKDGRVVDTVPVAGGQVVDALQARIRRRLTLHVPGLEYVPRTNSDLLAPFGTEVRIWRGVQLHSGEQLLHPLGVFGFSEDDISGVGGLTVVQAYDRSRRISRNRWIDPYVIAAGTNYGDAIRAAILDRFPTATFNFASTTATTPQLVFGLERQHDPWEDITKMAAAIGMDLAPDGLGVFTMAPTPDPDTAEVDRRLREGIDATLLGASRRLTDEHTYNVVVVTGEGDDDAPPVRGIAEDTNPSSPTYVEGPFGRRPYFITTAMVTAASQAVDAAEENLRKRLGASEIVSVDCVPDPTSTAGQVVEVVRDAVGANLRAVLDDVTTPLTVDGKQQLETRRRRT